MQIRWYAHQSTKEVSSHQNDPDKHAKTANSILNPAKILRFTFFLMSYNLEQTQSHQQQSSKESLRTLPIGNCFMNNKQMQDEEGFDNNQKLELIDFNYRPISLQHELKRNLLAHPRTKQSWQEATKYLPVRDDLREEYTQSLIAKDHQNVVFNNFSHEVGLQQHQISFQTDFESSNLEIVIRRKYLEYELYMRPDTNTSSYFQWFYFKIRCLRARKNVTLTIKNFVKSTMLYTQGLKPFYKTSKHPNADYSQLATEVKYTQCANDGLFSLKFCYQFQVDGEQVQFCSQPPYPFTKILEKMSHSKGQKGNLCKSQLGKKVPYLIYNEDKQTKAVVIAIARQHPGETIGSWMMEGFLNKLDQGIFESILWVVVPMINVDGVILGNNRTGIAGLDYNRYWNFQELQKKQKYFPEIISLLAIIKNIRRKHPKKVKMFLDFHGHSSQSNVFSYGPPHEYGSDGFILSRMFPQLLSKRNENFSLEQSSYIIKQDKRNTARSMLYSYFGIPFTYTIEGSFGLMRGKNVGSSQFIKIGEDIASAAQQFLCNYILKEKSADFHFMATIIKERFKQKVDLGEQYDSDSEAPQKRKDTQRNTGHTKSQLRQRLGRNGRSKLPTDISVSYHKDSQDENNSFQLFKIQQSSPQRRYIKHQGKRNQTQVTLSKDNKTSFLPKLKETFTSRQRMKTTQSKEQNFAIATVPVPQNPPPMMNIKEIQKHLFRLRNSRVGKKILIINAYGI